MARGSSLAAVESFDKNNLKKSETQEKNSLPDTDAIAQEIEHMKFKVDSNGTWFENRTGFKVALNEF